MRIVKNSLFCVSIVLLIFTLLGCSSGNNYAPVMNANLFSNNPTGARINNNAPFLPDHYMVGHDETLQSIADSFGIDPRQLIKFNHLTPPYRLYEGQMLSFREQPASTKGIASYHFVQSKAPVFKESALVNEKRTRHARMLREIAEHKAMLREEDLRADRAHQIRLAKAKSKKQDGSHYHKKFVGHEPKTAKHIARNSVSKTPWQWPAQGSVSEVGSGIDIKGRVGEPVLAALSGEVIYSQKGLKGYGNMVIVKHANQILTAYAHNQSLLVKVGQAVKSGQKIATMGVSNHQSPVLYFEVRKAGKPVNPLIYLPKKS